MTRNNESLDIAKQLVNDLYDFRDNYFNDFDIDFNAFKNKAIDVNNKLKDVITRLDELRSDCETADKAQYLAVRGRALNVTDKFDEKAYELLSSSVKLRPQLTEAWNQLGECYWKRGKAGDQQSALNCFESALKYEVNKISLRNSSMVLRQLGDTPEEKHNNLVRSVDRAKQAVECDVTDGVSWYILGNAYLTLFFRSKKEDSVLNACKVAYLKAYNDKAAKNHSDFLFNYASVLQYEEQFLKALECLHRAAYLDPQWTEPLNKKNALKTYLKDCCEMCAKRASLKPRRIQNFIDSLEKDLKLYSNQKMAKISELCSGENPSVCLIAKVIACINNESAMAHTYCVIDSDKQCVILLIYNLSLESGPKLGDTIVVEKPFVKCHEFSFDEISYNFKSIRIENPLNLIINNRKVSRDNIVMPKVDNYLRSD